MSAQIAVFAGPSLFHLDRPKYCSICDFYPPATSGDLLALIPRGYKVIVLLDGYYNSVPAPWHKEILLALALGRTVIGASSLGALRAAELSDQGMVGIGKVFEQFSNSERSRDSDVALLHAPCTTKIPYLPLSIPLVDLDYFLLECAFYDQASHDQRSYQQIENLSYQHRDFDLVSAYFRDNKCLDLKLTEYFKGQCRGIKNLDAIKAIDKAIILAQKPTLDHIKQDIDLVNVTTKQFYLLQSEANYFVKADQLIHDTYNEIYSSGRVQICAYLLMAVYCLGSSNSYQPIIQSLIESASYNQNKSMPAILDPEFIMTIDGTMLQPIAKKLELYLAIPNNKLIQCIKDYQRNQQAKSINRIIDLLFDDYAVFSITKLRLTINWFAVSAQYMHIMLNPGLINNVK